MINYEARMKAWKQWVDSTAVKWENKGITPVKPKFKYNNHNCTKNGGFCWYCAPERRKKAYFCNSYVIAGCVHGMGITASNFVKECKVYKGGGTGGMMRRDFNPAVKKGTFEVLSGIDKKHPLYANTKAQRTRLNEILLPGDVLIIARTDNKKGTPKICHTAFWYGDGMITEAAGDAGCCTRSSKFLLRGQGRVIVKVYRLAGWENILPKTTNITEYVITNKKGMNVRKKPTVKSAKVGHVNHDATVKATRKDGRWVYVPGEKGWICRVNRRGNKKYLIKKG